MRDAWKEADRNRMRDESRATFVLVEEEEEELADEELAMIPLVLPDPLPTRLNLRRYAPGIGIGLVIATAFLLGGLFMAPLWASGPLNVMTWIERVIG